MKNNKKQTTKLIEGGQGRTPEELQQDTIVCAWCFAGFLILIAFTVINYFINN